MTTIDYLGLDIYVAIYYTREDQPAFLHVAETYKRNIEKSKGFNSRCDIIILKGVLTKEDFKRVWDEIYQESQNSSQKIRELHIFSHSRPGNISLKGRTCSSAEIEELPCLPWQNSGKIVCHGCRSGLSDSNGNSLIKSFALSQKVTAQGQSGFSQFSKHKNYRTIFSIINPDTKKVYLWSYGDGGEDNTLGKAREPCEEYPQ